MLEVMIERWSQRDGRVDWVWSAWEDGARRLMGNAHHDAASAEMEARASCRRQLGRDPDEITVL